MHKSLHSSKSYCDCSIHQTRKPKNEEKKPTRKCEPTNTIPARGSSIHPEQMGGKEKKGRAEWLRITGSILTPESSKNQGAFLARNSVAVAPAFAHCTNRCTRRKVIVNAQPPRRKPKMKKICCYENRKTTRRTSARGTSSSGAQRGGREKRREGRMATDKT